MSEVVAPNATELLLAFAAGAHPAGEPLPIFDGADASGERDGIRLANAKLGGASLRRANLSRADLSGADLAEAVCSGIALRGARLEQAKLRGADLTGADLAEVDAGEADFSETLLEDAVLRSARLRFSNFTGAVMDGADLSEADLWGAKLAGVEAERAFLRGSRLDEAHLQDADLRSADLTGAILRRADLTGARLNGATLRDAVLDGATLTGADLSGATMPHVALTTCDLRHARFAGAWMERTRMRASQLGGAVGEEVAHDYAAACESYIVLEQNFRSLGSAGDASWAFRRRRRMGKLLHAERTRSALSAGSPVAAAGAALQWFADAASEWICDYGESVNRVARAFLTVLLGFAVLYWLSGCLEPRDAALGKVNFRIVDYLLFSLDSMTTVGTGEVGIKPANQLGVLLSSVQTVIGTVLLGLFGFVLGVRMRN